MITSVYPDDNRGSAALTLAAVLLVREAFPTAAITLMTPDPNKSFYRDHFRHTLEAIPGVRIVGPPAATAGFASAFRSLLQALSQLALGRPRTPSLQALREADLVVARGAVVFIDRFTLGALLNLFLAELPLLVARRRGVPVATLPTHIGPFASNLTRALTKWILRGLDLVMVRDIGSLDAAQELGVDPIRLLRLPDSVFHLDQEGPASPSLFLAADVAGLRFGVFTISVVAVKGENRDPLFSGLIALAAEMFSRDLIDRIVVVDQVSGARDSDVECSRDFVTTANDDRIRVCEMDLDVAGLLSLYSGAHFVLGCRLHANIVALVAGTPGFPLSVSHHKAERVFGSIGLGELVIPFPSFNVHETMDKIEFWTSETGRAEISHRVQLAHEALAVVPGILRELVDSRR